MSKRFTDTNKWRKPFIRGLQGAYKLFWFYILDDCDHAGIWIVDMEVAEIRIGESINQEDAIKLFGDKITIFDNGERWFILDFIEFQYGQLTEKNRAHNSVINILRKYNLLNKKMELISPLQGVKDKDKDKDMDKGGVGGKCLMKNSGVEIQNIIEAFNKTDDLKNANAKFYYQAAYDWSESKGEMRKDWVATVRSFARKDIAAGKLNIKSSVANGGSNLVSDPVPDTMGVPSETAISREQYLAEKQIKEDKLAKNKIGQE